MIAKIGEFRRGECRRCGRETGLRRRRAVVLRPGGATWPERLFAALHNLLSARWRCTGVDCPGDEDEGFVSWYNPGSGREVDR